jgi:hypothetical protein
MSMITYPGIPTITTAITYPGIPTITTADGRAFPAAQTVELIATVIAAPGYVRLRPTSHLFVGNKDFISPNETAHTWLVTHVAFSHDPSRPNHEPDGASFLLRVGDSESEDHRFAGPWGQKGVQFAWPLAITRAKPLAVITDVPFIVWLRGILIIPPTVIAPA